MCSMFPNWRNVLEYQKNRITRHYWFTRWSKVSRSAYKNIRHSHQANKNDNRPNLSCSVEQTHWSRSNMGKTLCPHLRASPHPPLSPHTLGFWNGVRNHHRAKVHSCPWWTSWGTRTPCALSQKTLFISVDNHLLKLISSSSEVWFRWFFFLNSSKIMIYLLYKFHDF
jgi:hypothetical protein